MLTYFKKMLAISVLGSLCIVQAHALTLKPHIGADYKFWEIKEKQLDFTRDYFSIFPYMSRAGTLYVGTRINKIWGLDFGYDRSVRKDEFHSYDSPGALTPVFGDTPVLGDAIQTDFRIEAWHLSGLFYWEILKNFELVFHIGVASLQPKSTVLYYHAALPNDPIDLRFQLKSKWVGRFGFGA
ncbi:MAG TPA: hypothetical protein VFP93_03510, partial [Gammaproteobacteria bacterium]|nr:hypothetical protein [Gammaproteobacteria bacterium]